MDELERVSRSARRVARVRKLLEAAIAARDEAIRIAARSDNYRPGAVQRAGRVGSTLYATIVGPRRPAEQEGGMPTDQ